MADPTEPTNGDGDSTGDSTPLTITDILAMKKPVTKTITVQLDGELAEEITELVEELRLAERSDGRENKLDRAPAIKLKLENLRVKAQATSVSFTFQSIGRVEYDALLELHKPTPQQIKEKMQFNIDTFPAALVAASCTEPKMEFNIAQAMFDSSDWNSAELQELFLAAFSANNEVPDIPLSNDASASTRNLLSNLLTQANEESPTQSS